MAVGSFFAALWRRPETLSRLSAYPVWNGVLYLLLGAGLYLGAGPVCAAVAAIEGFAVTDVGLVRITGMAVGIIGWFYVVGGRTGAASFGLATVADRALVPLLLLPLLALGEAPASLVVPFAVLDPVLAAGAYLLWRAECRTAT